ncbi:MAG: MATE family efflux transporter [Gammaproteobacteria bacterium]|nr:MATE family efflux transporter [Gammaproteobacteria bacterium]MDH4253762.1 MATE family efflux transporter [Gammaproteobacteria bacterium]MDH5309691.1 MATE family efflux transporter [Gammaproteobacteria bacterium]
MILSNVSVPLLGMVDTGVVGHLEDPAYLGAVAIGAAIFGFLFTGVNFLRMGTTGIAAQCYGANDYDGVRTALGQALIAALGIALLLILLQAPIGALGITLLGPGADVAAHARDYFDVRIWGALPTLANYVLIGWFIGLQNARVPLFMVLAANLTNIVLDLLFVVGFGMQVRGVAAASVIAELAGLAVGLWFVAHELARHEGRWSRERLLGIRQYGAYFAINAHLFVRTMALVFTLSFVTAQGARLGGLILAANAILLNLQYLLSFALDGFAHAAEALVGKAVGRRSRHALERSVAITLRWSLYVALGFAALYATAGRGLVLLLTDLEEVRLAAFDYLPWMVVSPLVSVWSFLYDGVFVGATRAREMRDVMLLSAVAVFLPAWYLLQPLGNHGLWLAFMLFMASRGIGMHLFYRQRMLPALTD